MYRSFGTAEMNNVIKYISKNNGYMGCLYGEKNLVIFDAYGIEVFKTRAREFDTYDELVKEVEEFPYFRRAIVESMDC